MACSVVGDDDVSIYLGYAVYVVEHTTEDGTLAYLQQRLGEVLGQLAQSGGISRCYHYIFHIAMGSCNG